MAIQAIGLFHLFYPLSFHYRDTVGKLATFPILPGALVAMTTDFAIRSGSLTTIRVRSLTLSDKAFIVIVSELINCGIFAILVLLAGWYRQLHDIRNQG
jgi:hypothetical protein